MNDSDLREMFRRRESDVFAPVVAPRTLTRRTRRRQLLTASVGVVAALLVVLGSVAGLRSLGSRDGATPGDADLVPLTTTMAGGITITYPASWFAVDPVAIGIEPNDTPRTLPTLVLALTRDDPHIKGVLGCPRLADVPPGQVLMTVQETPLALSGEASTPWPVPLQSTDLGGGESGGCYEGWTFMQATFTASGRSFDARVRFAPDTLDADRAALMNAYEWMTFSSESVAPGQAVTLGSGTAFDGIKWSLTASHDASGICWQVQSDTIAFGSCAGGAPAPPSITLQPVSPSGAFAVALLPGDVRSILLETGGQTIGDIGIFPFPETWGRLRLAVIPLPGSGNGIIRFQDRHGNDLYPPQHIDWAASAPPTSISPSGAS